jgi:CheY-like chemotaxis protein
MTRQLGQLVRLIDDLLDVSRITRGKLELRRSRVALADVIKTAIETSRPQIDAAKHELVVELPTEPVLLHADTTRLAQVIANLLNNAAKYTPKAGTIRVVATAGETLTISVSDTGIGLAPEHLGAVFDMFAQVAPLTTRTHGGLGIGLALSQALIAMHGGRIDAASAGPNQGSTFTIHLPLAPTPTAAESSSETPIPIITKLRVVVADDNLDAIEILAMFLERAGHIVHTAYDGAAALAAIKSFKPDVAVLDIGMPKMDGYEVARELRSDPTSPSLVLIALTGWGQAEDHRKSREAGFDYHLIKPVQPSTLVKLLSSASRSA